MKPAFSTKKGSWYLSLLAGLLVFTAFGCQTYSPAVTSDQMASEPVNDQILSAGDVVDVKFHYAAELNETQRVRPDGKIKLQLIGDVVAQGKTPEALQEDLNRLYAKELKKPSVTVTANTVRNNKVYVGGEVTKPGEVEILGQLTAFEAVSHAGGVKTETADKRNIIVVRSRGGKHYGTTLNFDAALRGKEVKPFYLRAGDIIYVPPTGIAKANIWVDQHISRMLPRVPIAFTP